MNYLNYDDNDKEKNVLRPIRNINKYLLQIDLELINIRKNADKIFINSELYVKMYDEIKELMSKKEYYEKLVLSKTNIKNDNLTIELLNEEIKRLENKNDELKSAIKDYQIKNKELRKKLREERSGIKLKTNELPKWGRKEKLKEEDKMVIKWLRSNGFTIRQLASSYKCSVGLIHKVLNEDKNK